MIDDADRSRLFWRLQLAGWTVYGLLAGAWMGAVFFGPGETVALALCRTGFGLLATGAVLRPLYRRVRRRRFPLAATGCGLFLLCGLLALLDGAAIGLAARAIVPGPEEKALYSYLFTGVLTRWMAYGIWSVLYFGVHLWLDAEQAGEREARLRAEAEASELRFLRAQVNPHFLFNALNTVLSETVHPSTRSLVQALADYLRFSLCRHAPCEPLGRELDALGHYLAVEKARFLEKLVYHIDFTEEARQAPAPVALVQPLLENAMKYGRQTSAGALELALSGRVDAGHLHVQVWNSGGWITPEGNTSLRTGLDNLRRRLALLYAGEATLSLTHDIAGVSAELSLPLTRSGTL
ncbi:MAG TPA: histidine kinase [Chthoniobacteraceae bacterium]|nr:histidine kinase [Chthoniobacteraceae bacterium]